MTYEPPSQRRDCVACAHSERGHYGGLNCTLRELTTSTDNRRAPSGVCGPPAVHWAPKPESRA